VRRDPSAWSVSENLLVSGPLWYHPSRCQPSQFIITAGKVVRESRHFYPRRIGRTSDVFGQESPSLSMTTGVEQIVPVALGERSYDIVLHPGLLATVGDRLSALTTSPKIGVVTDRHVASRYLHGTLRSLCKAGYDPPRLSCSGRANEDAQHNSQDPGCVSQEQVRTSVPVAGLVVESSAMLPVLLPRSINEEFRSCKCRQHL